MAAELSDGRVRETNIMLTPVGEGRFEIYVNGKKIYDRKEAGDADFYPSLREIRKVRNALVDALDAVPAHG